MVLQTKLWVGTKLAAVKQDKHDQQSVDTICGQLDLLYHFMYTLIEHKSFVDCSRCSHPSVGYSLDTTNPQGCSPARGFFVYRNGLSNRTLSLKTSNQSELSRSYF